MARRIKKDRGERKHRRTASHPECVQMMANANFDALPSLAEAMGLNDADVPYIADERNEENPGVSEE